MARKESWELWNNFSPVSAINDSNFQTTSLRESEICAAVKVTQFWVSFAQFSSKLNLLMDEFTIIVLHL